MEVSSYGVDHMVTGTTMQGPPQHLEVSPCLKAGSPHFVLYRVPGSDGHAAAFREGSFGQYEESAQGGTLKASGGACGGGFGDACRYVCNSNARDIVGTLCARDYKGVGSEFVGEGKVIVLERL